MSQLGNFYIDVAVLMEVMNGRILGVVILTIFLILGFSLYSLGSVGRNSESRTSQFSTLTSLESTTSLATSMSVATTTSSSSSLVLGRNVKLDNYSGTSGFTNGVEPYVAVGRDGTIHVVWLGLEFFRSTPYYEEGTTSFDYQIWYSESRDGGASFSSPVAVSLMSENTDPSIALAPNGDILVGYHHQNKSVWFSRRDVNSTAFQQILIYDGKGTFLDRPWIAVTSNGTIYATWSENGNAFWTMSNDNGVSFSQPTILGQQLFPTGMAVSGSDTALIALFSQLYKSSTGYYYDDWIAIKSASSNVFELTQLAEQATDKYPFGAFFHEETHPGPSVAAAGSTVSFAYASCNGSCLYIAQSLDNGKTWTSNKLVWKSAGLVEMPWMAARNNTLVVAWRDTAGGHWNAYLALYNPPLALTPVKVSDHDGYAATVLNWHGDFLGVALLGSDRVIVVWSDGRGYGSALNYGYGHIYVSIMPVT